MYSFQNEELVYSGLSADDVNTVSMARTGLDKAAGTADDYTATLVFEPDCALADIEVRFVDPFTDPDLAPGVLGLCIADVDDVPNPPFEVQNFSIEPTPGNVRILIKMNGNLTWDIQVIVVFDDGFESGDASAWDTTVP